MDSASKIRILIVDDHTMTRIGLRMALEVGGIYTVVGEAVNGTNALRQVEELNPDLVLMDLHMPDVSGIEICRRLVASYSKVKILILSNDISREMVDIALKIGVSGYLSKGSSSGELMLAVESAMAGRLYLSADVSAGILEDYRKSLLRRGKVKSSVISNHDKDLLRLISRGLRNKEIATELQVSGKSVEAYRSRLMRKLHCSSPAELVLYAVREGITRA
jgi:DNA-binding NarL/FixJ family response regulator